MQYFFNLFNEDKVENFIYEENKIIKTKTKPEVNHISCFTYSLFVRNPWKFTLEEYMNITPMIGRKNIHKKRI